MVTLSTTLNASNLKIDVFLAGKPEFRDSALLDAVTGYTPAYGDVLVIDKSDSNKHTRYDFDFASTEEIASALTSASISFANTSNIDPESIKIWAGTAVGTDSAAFTVGDGDLSYDNAIPGTATFLSPGTATVTLSGTITYQFVEENADQQILGIIDDVDDTDTANITLAFKRSCAVKIDNLGTDGTSTAAKKKILKDLLKDMNIETEEG
jgi:hypothetical protein